MVKRALVLCALGALIGYAAWSGPFCLLPLSLLMPACWGSAKTRSEAGLSVFAYHLAASRALPGGAATYFNAPILGAFLWIAAAVLLAAVWFGLWSPCPRTRSWRAIVALLIVSVPPIGIAGWVNPLTSAGALFPGWSWVGLAATLALLSLCASTGLRVALPVAATAAGLAYMLASPPKSVPTWSALDTHFDCGVRRDFMRDFRRITEAKSLAARSTSGVLLLGESVGGLWTPATESLWTGASRGTVVIGCELPIGDASVCDNTLVAVDANGGRVIYRQRMPVPVSMWRPGMHSGFRAHWFENPVVDLAGKRVAPLICYEHVLVWPVLHSAALKPDAFIAVANDWWCRGSSIPEIQLNALRSWSALFGIPLLTAFNF